MSEKERLGIGDHREIGERYWHLSRVFRVARSFAREWYGKDDSRSEHVVTFIQKSRMQVSFPWHVLQWRAQAMMRQDMEKKARALQKKDPSFKDLEAEERINLVKDALLKDYYELSKKAPRQLKMLEELFFNEAEDVEEG